MVLERPKVLFNTRSGKFVMWMHIDTADYELARLGVAIGDSPLGPFKYRGSFRPHGQQSRDFTVFAVSAMQQMPTATAATAAIAMLLLRLVTWLLHTARQALPAQAAFTRLHPPSCMCWLLTLPRICRAPKPRGRQSTAAPSSVRQSCLLGQLFAYFSDMARRLA